MISEFVLWKRNESGKWNKYNGIFPNTPASIAYQRAIRLIRNGWIPYAKKDKPGIHTPLQINADTADTSELENLINSDTVSIEAGKAFSEFYHDYSQRETAKRQAAIKAKLETIQGAIEFEPDLLSEIKQRAIRQAVEAYKAGKPIPPHLVNEVIRICTNRV